jgi:probable HAF family extracellular repeat protein
MVGLEPLIDADVNFSTALRVSDLGQVIGSSVTSGSSDVRAVIWDGSTFAEDLGTLAGALRSEAAGILPNGSVIVGNSNSQAVRWVKLNGVWTIDALPEPVGGANCQAVDIASHGTILGLCRASNGSPRVTIWENGLATDLGRGTPIAINRNGQVLVQASNVQAEIWDTRTNPVTVTQLGSLGGSSTSALDMNDFGDVVGASTDAALEPRPFLWTVKKGMIDLGTPAGEVNGVANAINNAGQIVGNVGIGTTGRAAYWFKGKVFDLGVLPGGYDGSTAQGLNASGQVVGFSFLSSGGNVRATLWNLK